MKKIDLLLHIINGDGKLLVEYDLNHSISSFIYNNFLRDNISDYHDSGKVKKFTFSKIMSPLSKNVKGKGILLMSRTAILSISSADEKVSTAILKNVDKDRIYKIDNILFKIQDTIVHTPQISTNHAFFTTITPICVSIPNFVDGVPKGQKFLNPSDSEYIDVLKRNILRKVGIEEDNTLRIKIFDVEDGAEIRKRKVNYKANQSIIANEFNFLIMSDHPRANDIINESYYSGFGCKTAQGLGLV